jgi:uncharacterized membrane protein YkvA (DUF1232 family)
VTKKISRIVAIVMFALALVFVWYALNHPESSWPWSSTITLILYGAYIVVMIVLFVAPFKKDG